MARFYKKRIQNKGLAPGSLVFIGTQKMEKPSIRVFHYDADHWEEPEVATPTEACQVVKPGFCTWIDIDGLHDMAFMEEVENCFNIHPILMEDVLNTGQRAKYEEVGEHFLVTLKMLEFDSQKRQVISEQLSMVVHRHYLITFQEREGDVFDAVRERIRQKKGRIRSVGTDYLAYALLDTIVDNYVYLIEHIGEQIEELELDLIEDADREVLQTINAYKRELNFMRKVLRPFIDLVRNMHKSDTGFITKELHPFLRDLLDIVTHANETIDSYRDMLADFMNIYQSSLNNRLNNIMKTLTIFSAVFIPLTFLAGIYGMNFEYMPELGWKWGYPTALATMFAIGTGMFLFLWFKKWF